MKEQTLKKISLGLVLMASALLIQACGRNLDPEASCNFVQNSQMQRVSWQDRQARFYIHDSLPQEYHQAVKNAANRWNLVVGREIIKIESSVGGSINPGRDGYNIIYFFFNNWEDNRKSEQARTTIYWSGKRIYEADIRINNEDHNFSAETNAVAGKVDLESLLVHEFGHVLGLAHVPSSQTSVMLANLANGDPRRDISDFDKGNLQCEYGI